MNHRRALLVLAAVVLVPVTAGLGVALTSPEPEQPLLRRVVSQPKVDQRLPPATPDPCRFNSQGAYVDKDACWAWHDGQPLEPAKAQVVKPYDGPCSDELEDESAFEYCMALYDDWLDSREDSGGGYPDPDPYPDRMP